ncbi:hypothetical protein HN011_006996 [Eciton burchellii]|nr:hypothetical protein HN011_006996 [Eciton burchellii]
MITAREMLQAVETAEPHYIPGYTGYCSQYPFVCGDTYARATHKLLLDPTISSTKTLILSDNTVIADCEIPSKCDVDVVNARSKRVDSIFVHPVVPGYEGFIPRLDTKIGGRYTVLATQGLAQFERQQLREKAVLNRLKETIDLQNRHVDRNLQKRLSMKDQFKLPLLPVRPECMFSITIITISTSRFRKEETNARRYASHIPHGYMTFVPKDDLFYDFVKNYRKERYTQCGPVTVIYPDSPILVQPSEIYHRHVGMISNYLGHIPGAKYRSGKTFGVDTKDIKKWVQKDSSPCSRVPRRHCERSVGFYDDVAHATYD